MYKQANLSFSVSAQTNGNDVSSSIQFSTQDKNSAKLVFTVKQGKEPLNLSDAEGMITLVMHDKSRFDEKATVTKPLDGIVEYTLKPEQIRHAGKVTGELRIVANDGSSIGGFEFSFVIKKALIDRELGVVKEFYIEDLESVKQEVKKKADAVVLEIDTFKEDIDSRTAAIEEQLESLDEDVAQSTVLQVETAKGTHANLDERIKSDVGRLTTQLADTAKKEDLDKRSNVYWTPPIQPPARIDQTGFFADAYSGVANDYLNLWESLRTGNPEYITRSNLGKDSSGTYDIWEYAFTPKNYTKTEFIVCGVHGGEVTPVLTLYRFFKHLTEDYTKYPQLGEIRDDVRFIVIPIVNPWGMSQKPKTRHNVNGVDLNRNFDFKWASNPNVEPFKHGYKGTAPFSEAESRYIRDTFTKYKDISVFFDFHNFGTPDHDYVLYAEPKTEKIGAQILDYLTKNIQNPDVDFRITQNDSSSNNYASGVLDIPAINAEWCDGRFGTKLYDSTEITKALEWYGNIVIVASKTFDVSKPTLTEVLYTDTGADAIRLSNTGWGVIDNFTKNIYIPADGILKVTGNIAIKNTGTGNYVNINPSLTQFGGFNPNHANTRLALYGSGSLITFPIAASIPVKRTNVTGGVEVAAFKLYGFNEGSNPGYAAIKRARLFFEYIPSGNYGSVFKQENITV